MLGTLETERLLPRRPKSSLRVLLSHCVRIPRRPANQRDNEAKTTANSSRNKSKQKRRSSVHYETALQLYLPILLIFYKNHEKHIEEETQLLFLVSVALSRYRTRRQQTNTAQSNLSVWYISIGPLRKIINPRVTSTNDHIYGHHENITHLYMYPVHCCYISIYTTI